MKIEIVKISKVKLNGKNPRLIKDDKFKKLVQSIKDFPQMLEIRPIVVNADMIVLGGNMRLRACMEAGLKDVYIIKADNLTEDQQKEFLIKDNVSGGEWDWDLIANDWDIDQIDNWGVDLPVKVFLPESTEEQKVYNENKYPLSIVLNKAQMIKWDKLKQSIDLIQDTNAFVHVLENFKAND